MVAEIETKLLERIPAERELIERTKWFTKLRWYAGSIAIAGTLFACYVLGLELPKAQLVLIGFAIIAYNFAFKEYSERINKHSTNKFSDFRRFAHIQISVDWIALIGIAHYSGGILSPILPFFLFHVIIASILLSRRDCYLQVIFVTWLFALTMFLEYYNVISSVKPTFLPDLDNYSRLLYLLSFLFTLYIAAFVVTSVASTLKSKERALMNQQRELETTYYNLAHELRRPVAAIEQMLNNIIKGYAGEISERARDLINRSKNRCHLDLRATINDILDWARRGVGLAESVMTDVLVRDVVEEALDDAQGIAETKDLIIKQNFPDESLTVKGDKPDLEKMLKNLLENAVKYTPPGGTVTLSVQRINDCVKIVVADTGIGIPPSDLDKIFTEFYRSENAKRSGQYGTGLGLSIVKRIVDEHKGSISVSSELGGGTKFTVLLPTNYGKMPPERLVGKTLEKKRIFQTPRIFGKS